MGGQHLSDEATAAFADDVLSGSARDRARRHTAACAECNHAVVEQRAAIWALRSAPAPALPLGLLDRLRDVPASTPIRRLPTVVDERGTTMFATFAAPAALVPTPVRHRSRRARPFAITAASVAFVGAMAAAAAHDNGPAAGDPTAVHPVNQRVPVGSNVVDPVDAQLVRATVPVRAR
jgi:anti-sigma factor RsiW